MAGTTIVLPAATVGTFYNQVLNTAGGNPPYSYQFVADTTPGWIIPPGLSLLPSGNISGSPTTPGTYSFIIGVKDTCAALNYTQKTFSITVNQKQGAAAATSAPPGTSAPKTVQCPPLTISALTTPQTATMGQPYLYQLKATGGQTPNAFGVKSGALPPGLAINNSGAISGTPTKQGNYGFAVTVSDACPSGPQKAETQLSLTVTALPAAKCPAMDFYSNIPDMILPPGLDSTSYASQLTASGGQPAIVYIKVSGDLPPGLTLSPSGLISGIPALPNEINQNTGKPINSKWYAFTVRAKDNCAGGGQTADKQLKILVQKTTGAFTCKPLIITSQAALPAGFRDKAYSYQFAAEGESPFTHSLVSGSSLPPGLSLSQTGEISGTPSTVGSYSFTILFVDTCLNQSQFSQKNFTIQIQEPPMNLSVIPTPSSFNIPQGQASSKGVIYNFSGSPTATVTLQSSGGSFLAGGAAIWTVSSSLTANIIKGSASVPEVISIPIGVIQKAALNKVTKMSYVRTFTGTGATLTSTVDFNITTAAGADFDLNKIELYFAGKAITATVERNKPDFKAFVDLTFAGSGQLSGEWRMDGNLIATVLHILTPGQTTTVQFSQILPTFNLGTHVVTFVVKTPVSALMSPAISFVVVPAAKPKITGITPDHLLQGKSYTLAIAGQNLGMLTDLDFGQGNMWGITKTGPLTVTSETSASIPVKVHDISVQNGARDVLMKYKDASQNITAWESTGVSVWVGNITKILKIEPSTLAPDQTYELTISGSYFADGMDLFFQDPNTSNPPQFADRINLIGNVTVLSDSKATVTVKVGKYAQEGEWKVCAYMFSNGCISGDASVWVKYPVPPADVKAMDDPKRKVIVLLTPLPGHQGENLSEYTNFRWNTKLPNANTPCGAYAYEIRFYRGGAYYTEAFQGSQYAQGAQPGPGDQFELLFKDQIFPGKFNTQGYDCYADKTSYQLSGSQIADLLRKGVVWWEVAAYDHGNYYKNGDSPTAKNLPADMQTVFSPAKEKGLSEMRELNTYLPQWGLGAECKFDKFKGQYGGTPYLDNKTKGTTRNDDWAGDDFEFSGQINIASSPYKSDPVNISGSYVFPNVLVDWGDGSVEPLVSNMAGADAWKTNMVAIALMHHTYTSTGAKTVRIFMVPEDDVQHMNPVDILGNADAASRVWVIWCDQRDIKDRDDPYAKRMLHLESIDIVSYNGLSLAGSTSDSADFQGKESAIAGECAPFSSSAAAQEGLNAVMSSCDKLQAAAELKYWGHGRVYLKWSLNRQDGGESMLAGHQVEDLQSESRKGLTEQSAQQFTQAVIDSRFFRSDIIPMPGEDQKNKWDKKYSLSVEAQIDTAEAAALDAETVISIMSGMSLFSANDNDGSSLSDVNAEAENWRPGRLYAAKASGKPAPSQTMSSSNPYAKAILDSGVKFGLLSPSKEASKKGSVQYLGPDSGSNAGKVAGIMEVPHVKPYYVKSDDFTYKVKKSVPTQPCYFDFKTASGVFEIGDVHCKLTKNGSLYNGTGNMLLNLTGAKPLLPLIHINGWTLGNDGIAVKQGEIHEDLSAQKGGQNVITSGMDISMVKVDGTAVGSGMMLTLNIKPKVLGLKLFGGQSEEASWQGAAPVTPAGDWFWTDSQPKEMWIGGSGFKIKSSDFRIDLSSKEGLDASTACGGAKGAAWTGIHFGNAAITPNTFDITTTSSYAAPVSDWVIKSDGICGTAAFGKFEGSLNNVKIGYQSLDVHTEPGNLLTGTYHGMYVTFPWWGVSFAGDTIFGADGANEDPYIHYENLIPTPTSINLDLGPISLKAGGFHFERMKNISWSLRSDQNSITLKGEGNTEAEKTFIKDIALPNLVLDKNGALHFINDAPSANLTIPTGEARVNRTRITPLTGTASISGGGLNINIAGDVRVSKTFEPPKGTVDYRLYKKDDTVYTSTGPDIKVEDIAFSFPPGNEQAKGKITGMKQTQTAYQTNGAPVYAQSGIVTDAVPDASGWQAGQQYAMAGGADGLPPGSLLLADAGSGQNWKDRFNGSVNMNLFPGMGDSKLPPSITIRMGNFTDVDDDYWLINFNVPLGPGGVPIGPLSLFSINGGMFYNFPPDVFSKAGCGVQVNNVDPVSNGSHSLTAGVEIGLATKSVLDLKGQLTLSLGGGAQARIEYCGWLFSSHPGSGSPLCDGDVVYGGGSLDGHIGCSLKIPESLTFTEATVERNKTAFHFGSGNWYVQGAGKVGMIPLGGDYLLNGDAAFYFGTDKFEFTAGAGFDKTIGDCDDVCLGASAYIGATLGIQWSPSFYARAGVKAGAEVHACAFDCCVNVGRDIFGLIQTESPFFQVGSCFSWPVIPDFSIVADIVPPGIHLHKEHCDDFKARYGF